MRKTLVLVGTTAVLVLVALPTTALAAETWVTTRITNNTNVDDNPQVSGDRVVWGGGDGHDYEIYTWTPGGGTIALTNNAHDDLFPQVSGDRVVWQHYDGSDYEIYTWTPGGGTVPLTSNAYWDWPPQVSGDRVVWYGDDGSDYEIYTWTPSGGVKQISGNTYDDMNPQVSGGQVVWARGDTNGIYTWNQALGSIYYKLYDQGWYPQVSGDRVVWWSFDGSDDEILTWTPSGTISLTNNSDDDSRPQVSGDRVVWIRDDGSDGEIYAWTPGEGEVRLTDNADDDYNLHVSGDRVVWAGYDGHDYEIFTAAAFSSYDDKDPKITYTPAWSRWDYSGYWAASGDTYAYTDKAGYTAIVTFEGTELQWVACTSNTKGKAEVTLDPGTAEEDIREVDLYSPSTIWKKTVYSTGPLTLGTHTVFIECLRQKNGGAWWYTIDADRFDIAGTLVQSPAVTKVDDKDLSRCTYYPVWSRWDNSGYWAAYMDTYAYTDKEGDELTVTFHGTHLTWVACTSNTKGKAEVVLDGDTAHSVTVDLYSPSTLWKQNVYSTGVLPDTNHTLVIKCLHEKNPASGWYTIDADRFDILLTGSSI